MKDFNFFLKPAFLLILLISVLCLGLNTFAIAKSQAPNPEITVNQSNGPLHLLANQTISVQISLDPGQDQGQEADWWIATNTPSGWRFLVLENDELVWVKDIKRCLQGPLIKFQSLDILNVHHFLKGKNYIYFALDNNADGELDATWWDYVEVNVLEYQAQKEIGPQGGNIKVSSTSPINGTEIQFPKNALSRSQTISIGQAEQPAELASAYQAAGPYLKFSTNGSHQFNKPVLISIPYNDADQDSFIDGTQTSENMLDVLYWNDLQDQWEKLNVLNLDTEKNLAQFETDHFSVYLTTISENNGKNATNQTGFLTGESFIGEPEFLWIKDRETDKIIKKMVDPGGGPEYLTITRRQNELLPVIGPHPTTGTGHAVTNNLNTGPSSFAIFNATALYPKVAESGDTNDWNWTCDFVSEHTYLQNYDAIDESVKEPGKDAIFCETKVVNKNLVQINWTINATQEIIYPTTKQGLGHMLVVEFMGTYAK